MAERIARLDVDVAYHYLGSALDGADGIGVPSNQGPFIDALADVVRSVTVLAYAATRSPGFEDGVEYVVSRDNVRWVSLGPRGTWRDSIRRRRRVRSIVRAISAGWDVLYLRLPNRRLDEVAGANRCPRVVTIDGSMMSDEARLSKLSFFRGTVRRLSAARAERHARRVIASSGLVFVNSPLLAERHRGVTRTVEVLAWSLRSARFHHIAGDRLTSGAPNLVVAGRVASTKGVFEALDAFRELRNGPLPNAHLHVLGDGPELEELRRRIARDSLEASVTVYGWVPIGEPLFSIFRDMDVLLHLSYVESFPRVIWEALAHSVLVVCTAVGGLPQMVEDGREVLFVGVRDARAAAAAVERLVREPGLRSTLLGHGYARARTTDLERVVGVIVTRTSERWPDLASDAPRRVERPR